MNYLYEIEWLSRQAHYPLMVNLLEMYFYKKSNEISYKDVYNEIKARISYENKNSYDMFAVRETSDGFINYGYAGYFDVRHPRKIKFVMLKLENENQSLFMIKTKRTICKHDLVNNKRKQLLFSELFDVFDYRIKKNEVWPIYKINRMMGKAV